MVTTDAPVCKGCCPPITPNPHKSVLNAGVRLAFGSDCMPLDPLFGIIGAMNHPAPNESLTFEQALRAYTWGGAYAGRIETLVGTLEPGKQADLVVLTGHPAKDPNARVVQTYISGQLGCPSTA